MWDGTASGNPAQVTLNGYHFQRGKNNVQIVASVTPSASNDKTYRLVAGLDERAIRDAQFQVSPLTASTQWGLTRVVVMGVASAAGPLDE